MNWSLLETYQATNTTLEDEFLNLCQFELDTSYKACKVTVSFSAKSDQIPVEWWVSSKVSDQSGNSLTQFDTDLERSFPSITSQTEIKLSQLVNPVPSKAFSVQVFVWNIHKKKLELSNIEVSVFYTN